MTFVACSLNYDCHWRHYKVFASCFNCRHLHLIYFQNRIDSGILYIYLYLQTPTALLPPTGHILPINFIADTWRQWFWSTLPPLAGKKKSNRNFIMVSPLSGPADPHFRGGFHPTSHSGGAIFFDHISFIAPLAATSVCTLLLLQISPGLLVFILDLDQA